MSERISDRTRGTSTYRQALRSALISFLPAPFCAARGGRHDAATAGGPAVVCGHTHSSNGADGLGRIGNAR